MSARWKTGYEPAVIVDELKRTRQVGPDGKISFKSFGFDECRAALSTMLDIGPLPELDARGIVTKAIFEASKSPDFSPDSIVRIADKLLVEFNKNVVRKYRLLTSMSFAEHAKPAKLSFQGTVFTFSAPSRKFRTARDEAMRHARYAFAVEPPTTYSTLIVHTEGRTPTEAAERALTNTDLLRALWNFGLNRGQTFRLSSGQRQPVNRILTGPIHTLHDPDGSSAGDTWWYEPQYMGPVALFDKSDHLIKTIRFQRKMSALLHKHNYKAPLQAAFVRYCRALDLRDWESCYLQLWSALELLTDTGTNGYGVTVRRASALYLEREYARQVLLHLRDRRNHAVHEGKSHEDIESLIYQLKRYVEGLLLFHLGTKHRFESIQEAAAFLDLPVSRDELIRKLRTVRYALKFRGL